MDRVKNYFAPPSHALNGTSRQSYFFVFEAGGRTYFKPLVDRFITFTNKIGSSATRAHRNCPNRCVTQAISATLENTSNIILNFTRNHLIMFSWSGEVEDRPKEIKTNENICLKDVRANCFCASLLRTQIHATSCMSVRALSNKINNDREDGHCCSFTWI